MLRSQDSPMTGNTLPALSDRPGVLIRSTYTYSSRHSLPRCCPLTRMPSIRASDTGSTGLPVPAPKTASSVKLVFETVNTHNQDHRDAAHESADRVGYTGNYVFL